MIEEIKKIALSFYDDKIIQSIDSTETYAHGTSKDLVFEKEETKCNYIIKQLKTFNYITEEDIKEHTPNSPEIPGHPYRIIKLVGSGSGKTNALLNVINHEADIDKNSSTC